MIAEKLVSEITSEFTAEELPGGLYEMSSLGIGPNEPVPDRPYIVYKELPSIEIPEVSETSDVEHRIFQIFVYDYKGDFTTINQYLHRIKRRVKAMAPFNENGTRCSGSVWGGMSGTIVSDGYDSSVRYGIARFTVSES